MTKKLGKELGEMLKKDVVIDKGILKLKGIKDEVTISKKERLDKAGEIFTRRGQARTFNNIKPIFYDKSGMFWLWNDKECFWEISDDIDILNMIFKETGEDIINSKNRTEILNALKQEGRLNMPKEIKKTWIQFKDIIFDISSGERFKATPEYFVTNPIPFAVSGDPRTPNMDRIFEEWVGKDYVKTLYEIIAFSLLADYPINRLFCFIGGGMNGKSCFLNLLKKFVGEKNVCATELDLLMASKFEVTRLYKKLICLMGETNFNEMSKTSIIKKLTGQDTIGFEYKNKTPFEDINYAKIMIATNNLPTTTDKTIGFYRRWLIVDFPNTFSEKKDILADIPEEEYNNLATNCVIILNDLIKKRKFHKEGTVEERMERYEAKSNFLDKFLDLFVNTENSSLYITKADFSKKFKSWCKENRNREMSDIALSKELTKKGFESGSKHFEWLFDGKGGNARIWYGMIWKE